MSWIPKPIHRAILKYTYKNSSEAALRVMAETKSGGKKTLTDRYDKEAITMAVKTLEDWKLALMMASDPESPNWYYLHKVYENMKLDQHLMGTIDNRIEPVQSSPFKFVDDKGNEVEEVKELFEAMWFIDFIGIALRSKFEGTKVVELYDLDDDLELKDVLEVDMGNVVPQKGIITKEPGGETGWSYREGAFKDQYIQIGKNNFLGLFAQLTPIVLAKKLAMGSWLDYIDKFGVPAVFAITDREDQERLDQLFEALTDFKSNNFMVGRGNEKFETMESGKTDAYNTFDKLTDRANSEMSKRIVGGTGITDEKSFVGAAEIHEKALQAKIKLDKFFVKILVNKELIPRLVKISPVYAPLEKLKFEWDDAESLSLKDFLEALKGLSPYYEFDIEEISQTLGMTVTAIKQAMKADTDPQDGEKKKPNEEIKASLKRIDAEYHPQDCSCGMCSGTTLPEALNIGDYEKLIDTVAKQLHGGLLKPEDLNRELIRNTYYDLAKGAKQGYGKNWLSFPEDGKGSTPAELKKNIYAFSGAKTYAHLEALNQLIYDSDGKLRPYNDFEVLARKSNRQYNKNYLQAEYQTARTAAQMAEKWERIQESKKLFPNLKYQTVGDDRVRPDHERLDGIIKPIDDDFWSRYYPPLDWRCRCDVTPTAEKPTKQKEEDLPKVQFKGNVGKDKEIFTRKGGFFKLASGNENAKRNMELSKLYAPSETAHAKAGKKVTVSIFKDEEDFQQNYSAAIVLVDELGININIRPHVNVDGHKNPEYLIGGKLSDLKWQFKTDNYKGISNAFTAAKKQDLETVVFDFSYSFRKLDIKKVNDEVARKVNKSSGKRYEGLYFIYGAKAVYVTRTEILAGKLIEKLETIKADS